MARAYTDADVRVYRRLLDVVRVYRRLLLAGVDVYFGPDGRMWAWPASAVTPELVDLIRRHRSGLAEIIRVTECRKRRTGGVAVE